MSLRENMYKLSPAEPAEIKLFFRLDGEEAERHGAVCGMQIDFERGEDGALSQRFNCQRHLKTPAFKADLKNITDYLRGEAQSFGSMQNFRAFCREHEGQTLSDGDIGHINVPFAFGVGVRTQDYSYYFRCHPAINRVNIFAYDNRYLLPELAGLHELPKKCFSMLPSTGERVLIWRGQSGYERFDTGKTDRAALRVEVDRDNARWGVTRAQEEAMLAGSRFGWGVPAAKPWRYEQDGTPRTQPKRDVPER